MTNDSRDYQYLYRQLVDELSDFAIFLLDTTGRITSWNPGVARILGYEREEFIGIEARVLFTEEDRAQGVLEREMDAARRDGRAPDMRWHVRRDGRRVFIDGVMAALHGDGGQVVSFTKVMRDVTRQKETESQLKEALSIVQAEQKRTREILESINDTFYALDAEFRFTYVNKKAEERWRRGRNELLGQSIWTVFPQAIGTHTYDMHVKAMAERCPVQYETLSPVIHRWIDVSVYPEANGGISCFFRDITERKYMESALQESEERFRAAFANAPIGMVLTTVDGTVIETNQAYRDIVGYTAEEITGTQFLTRTHPEDIAWNRTLQEKLLRGEIPTFTVEKRYIRKNGEVVWVRASATVRRDADGRPTHVVRLIEDIHERKRAERERERLVTELERSNEELARFAHIVSHDLQAPLRTVKGYTGLLGNRYKGKLDEDADEFIALITQSTESMEQLIQGLLKYAEAGEQKPALKPVVMEKVIDTVLSILDPAIREVHGEVTCGPLPTVKGDPILLQQLMQNLISNALKYRRPDVQPRIHIESTKREDEWLFSVKDNGLGIESDYLERVFEPLKRLHGKSIPGTGIGLAICRKIVERHGGHIWVESQPGSGSAFLFTLPT